MLLFSIMLMSTFTAWGQALVPTLVQWACAAVVIVVALGTYEY